MKKVATIGSKEKHDAFLKRHEKFFDHFQSILDFEKVAFDRSVSNAKFADPIIFYLGIRILGDFMAIMLLAAYGHGLSALALLRGMYERVVTAAYLRDYPDEAELFADYDFVQRYKTAQQIKETIGVDPEGDAAFSELQNEYEQVKNKYEVPLCKQCGTTRVNHTWNKLDIVAMAHQSPPLQDLVVPAYYVPLGQAHATLKSISAYLKEENGRFVFQVDHSDQADQAFRAAHLLLMHSFQIQAQHFKIPEIEKAFDQAMADYRAVWEHEETATEAGSA